MTTQRTGSAPDKSGDPSQADADTTLAALERIKASPEFDGADRIQGFLDYVVRETLEGRGEEIRAKTIFMDVYRRSPGEGHDPMAIVRVDAGRLRRRLTEYYSGSGRTCGFRIHIDPGGYVPRFETVSAEEAVPVSEKADPVPAAPSQTPVRLWLAACLLLAALGGLTWWGFGQKSTEDRDLDKDSQHAMAVREALLSSSPEKLQAVNLATQTRGLLFPALDPRRLQLVLAMFELAIDMDENHFGGYAGAAQVAAILAILQPPGELRDATLTRAQGFAERALDLGIGQSWSHSAEAMVVLAGKDYDQALAESARAVSLDPEDADALAVDAIIALFGGEFQRAITSAQEANRKNRRATRFPLRGATASAHFHLGNYRETLRLYNEAALAGEPISAITLSYLVASNVRLGDADQAAVMLDLLNSAWPGYPLDHLFRSLYRDPAHASDVIDALKQAGWDG